MSKPKIKTELEEADITKVNVIKLSKSEGAYGYTIYEIPESVLLKNSEVLEKSEPDVYAIFVNNIIGATRRIFGF